MGFKQRPSIEVWGQWRRRHDEAANLTRCSGDLPGQSAMTIGVAGRSAREGLQNPVIPKCVASRRSMGHCFMSTLRIAALLSVRGGRPWQSQRQYELMQTLPRRNGNSGQYARRQDRAINPQPA